jgi:hypothetical protein
VRRSPAVLDPLLILLRRSPISLVKQSGTRTPASSSTHPRIQALEPPDPHLDTDAGKLASPLAHYRRVLSACMKRHVVTLTRFLGSLFCWTRQHLPRDRFTNVPHRSRSAWVIPRRRYAPLGEVLAKQDSCTGTFQRRAQLCAFLHPRYFSALNEQLSQVCPRLGSHVHDRTLKVRFFRHVLAHRRLKLLPQSGLVRMPGRGVKPGRGVPPESVPQTLGVSRKQGMIAHSSKVSSTLNRRILGLFRLAMTMSLTLIQTLMRFSASARLQAPPLHLAKPIPTARFSRRTTSGIGIATSAPHPHPRSAFGLRL